MRNASKRLAFKLSLWGIGIGCFGGSIAQAQSLNSGTSQPLKSVMVLTASSGETPIKILSNESSEFVLDQRENEGYVIDGSDLESDTIRERFPDGKVRIERKVVLDDEGNYINHGPYQEWTSKGELVTTGSFVKGKRHGPWIQMCDAKGAKLVTTYPYSKFKAPFQSSVEFDAGMMDGVWTITDADNKVVSQIQLAGGKRDGLTTFFHPNGQVFYQAEYSASLLNGSYVEKSMEGRVVRDEKYTAGQRTEVVQEHFPNKTIKSEISYLNNQEYHIMSM